ncbi:MAG: FapA family protein [Gammaproteobacteria bacterium]|nr:FapA family protein [Gammaproteobacteria bacterium]
MTDASLEDVKQNRQGVPVNDNFWIRVADDQLAVYLDCHMLPGNTAEAVTVDSVMACLKSQKITASCDKEKINTILLAPNTHATDDERCIARGVAPIEGDDDALVWNIPEHYLRQGCAIVLPGEIIASYKKAGRGQQGRDVYGNNLTASNGASRCLHIGAGIKTKKVEAGDEYIADSLGIVNTEQDHAEFIQVDKLVKISDDGMEATMDIYAQSASGQAISCEHIMTELAHSGVTQGIDQDVIQFSLKKAANVSSNRPIACVEQVVVAKGVPPEPGKDASLIISRDENVVGAELSNGFIDFHELGYPWNVSEGDRIGYLLEARPGVEGMMVNGTIIKVKKPKDIKCKFEGVHKDDKGRLIADLDGALIINGNSLVIVELLVIDGDIGPKTGNVHSKISVHVKGYVKPGYILESEKDVIVERNVEDAIVRSGGSILIKGGIRGMKSKIYAPSDVRAGFVENASIYVNGELIVNGSIMNSTVATNGKVIVGDQKIKHSMVVGGELIVNKYLEVVELGSDAYPRTLVRLGMGQEERRQIMLLDKEMDEVEKKLQRIEQLKYRHRLTPKDDTKEVLYKLAIAGKALVDQHQAQEVKKNTILEQLKETDGLKVVVKKCAFPGVTVIINDCSYQVKRTLAAGCFVYDKLRNRVMYSIDQPGTGPGNPVK